MNPIKWKSKKVIDAHTHYFKTQPVEHFQNIIKSAGYDRICILGGTDRYTLERKNDKAGDVYLFGMLNQTPEKIAAGDGAYLVAELENMLERGYDGIKMMDGKPSLRRSWQPLGVNHPYFNDYWKRAEELKVPITAHCVDPVEYWHDNDQNNYSELGTQEKFFQEALEVMERHPNLRINFPHFFFMGPNLPRLGELFDKYPNMRVDMALGPEYLYYMSDNPEASRDFCIKYSDRILYGTDISERNSPKHGWSKAETIRLFLETDEEFDNLVFDAMGRKPTPGSNGRLKLRGLQLPQDVLENIMWRNFEAFAGNMPASI